MNSPAHRLANALARYAMNAQGRTPHRAKIVLIFGDGNKIKLTMREHDLTAETVKRDTMESAVRQVIEEMEDGEKLTGKQIAERAGYGCDARMRTFLASLVDEGVLVNHCPGYAKPK